MSDYDIRPKPKVWAGSPNECGTFGRMLCARIKQRLLLVSAFIGTQLLENVLVTVTSEHMTSKT